jgi:hypothetical protein
MQANYIAGYCCRFVKLTILAYKKILVIPILYIDMAYTQIPKDLTKIKSKIFLGMTARQAVCFGSAALIGVPVFFATREALGNSTSVLLMMVLMLPAFFVAMYEKDGQPAERILLNILRSKWFFPAKRPYKTENFYSVIEKEGSIFECREEHSQNKKAHTTKKTIESKCTSATGKQKRVEKLSKKRI